MQMPDYDRFFRAYVDFYNAALENKPVIEDLRQCYGEYLVGASGTEIVGGENNEEFGATLDKGYGFYRELGVSGMQLRGTEPTEIAPGHDLVRVSFRAIMAGRKEPTGPIDFDIAYLLQRRDSGPKIFAFASVDELALFREMGLVDAEGKPT